MSLKRSGKLLLVALVAATFLTSCGGTTSEGVNSGSNKSADFTYFLSTGDDTSYYSSFEKNPTMNFLLNHKTWGDNNAKVSVAFSSPATGDASKVISTMIGSGDYTDIMDVNYYKSIGTIQDLYDQGIALDLTDYVDKYMPNYKKWLDDRPLYKKLCTSKIDGETKNIELWDVNDTNNSWGGFCYRRDWLVKYGTNPTTNAAFTGGYDANKVWTDDVVFPSGETDPKTFADWEWMLPIFKKALAGEGISDGYCMSIPYGGYYGTGDLAASFGVAPMFYLKDDNKTIGFGGNTSAFREYLKLMNKWYKAGYIDTKFAEHTSDMFYQVDSTKVHQGKVGMWYGTLAAFNDGLDISEGKPNSATDGYTNGICVFGAKQPINTTLGTSDIQNVNPVSFYQIGLTNSSVVVTNKAQDKDLPALLRMFDYMYSDEGVMLCSAGLSKEEEEETQDPLYIKNGLTNGAYHYVDSTGADWVEGTSTGKKLWTLDAKIAENDSLQGVVKNNRTIGRRLGPYNGSYTNRPAVFTRSLAQWDYFTSNFYLFYGATGKLSGDAAVNYTKVNTQATDFLNKWCPKMITGEADINNDSTWNGYLAAINKYKITDATTALQTAYDNM
ncbi:MAG: hypothetical protein LKJ88_08375 [Bacilli bacterium]|jgi:hypothetical protein|nr:hypothetical protein [Bacilli bacterium]